MDLAEDSDDDFLPTFPKRQKVPLSDYSVTPGGHSER